MNILSQFVLAFSLFKKSYLGKLGQDGGLEGSTILTL
jgi:hypothetical protein